MRTKRAEYGRTNEWKAVFFFFLYFYIFSGDVYSHTRESVLMMRYMFMYNIHVYVCILPARMHCKSQKLKTAFPLFCHAWIRFRCEFDSIVPFCSCRRCVPLCVRVTRLPMLFPLFETVREYVFVACECTLHIIYWIYEIFIRIRSLFCRNCLLLCLLPDTPMRAFYLLFFLLGCSVSTPNVLHCTVCMERYDHSRRVWYSFLSFGAITHEWNRLQNDNIIGDKNNRV